MMVRHGHGTPLPLDAPRALVVAGPYGYIRNPMAMGSFLQGIAVGFHRGSPLVIAYALTGAMLWDRLGRPWEEADLEARFSDAYREYRTAVACWVPRTDPWAPTWMAPDSLVMPPVTP